MSTEQHIAYAPIEDIEALQLSKLQQLVQYLNERSPYYKGIFQQQGISPDDIKSLSDLERLPFTTKDDLAQHNDEMLCVAKSEVADFVTTSGTLGDPVTFYMTANDLDRLANNEALSLSVAGGTGKDIYQLMTTMDKRFMAGLAYYLGVQKMKAGIVRVGPGAPYLQWESIRRFEPTVLIAIPSFIPKLIQFAKENGIDHTQSSVKSIVCIGEPIRDKDLQLNELGKRITSQWDVKLHSTYASTEMGAAFTECEAGNGGHLQPELLILEVIDDNGKQVANGELGEVVVTTLGVEGMPLLRYRTGDLCHVHYDTCSCGRNTPRLGPIIGRKQQMIKYKGTTIFPPSIFDVLDMVPEIKMYQVEVLQDEFGNDLINILLPSELDTEGFIHELRSLFRSKLRVAPDLKFIELSVLEKKVFKAEKRKPEKLLFLK